MSLSTQPIANSTVPPAKSVSLTILILSLALAVCATAAVILAVLHFRSVPPASGGSGGTPLAALGEEPYVQKDTVSPQKAKSPLTGLVYYPMPYASPPNLKLTSSKRQYDIAKQDELGFTWSARLTLDDIPEDIRKKAQVDSPVLRTIDDLMNTGWGVIKPNAEFEDFTWEAKGIRASKDMAAMAIYPQEGTFDTSAGTDGQVNFQYPYAVGPNVVLTGNSHVIVVECGPTGFKWKNCADKDKDTFGSGSHPVNWTARGIRATEIPKSQPN
jgi:hypothetical protein